MLVLVDSSTTRRRLGFPLVAVLQYPSGLRMDVDLSWAHILHHGYVLVIASFVCAIS